MHPGPWWKATGVLPKTFTSSHGLWRPCCRSRTSGRSLLSERRPYAGLRTPRDRKSTRLNSSHANISYAVFCLKKKKKNIRTSIKKKKKKKEEMICNGDRQV